MSNIFVVINEELVPSEKAIIYINDLAIQRGYGVFDFFKLLDGRPIFLDDHLARFYNSAAQMRLPVKQNPKDLKELLLSLTTKNNLPNSGVRLTLTGGYSSDGFGIADPNLIITQQALSINKDAVLTGTRLVSYPHQRQLPSVKTIDYLMAIWLRNYIAEHHADDVLYQQNGVVTECPRANFFIITQDGIILTPSSNILKGVMRKQVLSIARKCYQVEERNITLDDVYQAKEVFITSTTKTILPVVQVDGHIISDAKPGEITRSLQTELQQHILSANSSALW